MDGFTFGCGTHILEPAFSDKAFSTRSGVSGRKGEVTPIAFATAVAMAAPGEITGGSPRPEDANAEDRLVLLSCRLALNTESISI